MKAVFAIRNDGARMLVGIKQDDFDVPGLIEQRAATLKQNGFTTLVEEPLLEALSVNELVEMTNDLIAALRDAADEPVVIRYAEDVTIEVRPNDDDDRVLVSAKGRGDTIVNYQPEGLVVDIHAEEEIGTLSSTWFDNSDLVIDEDA